MRRGPDDARDRKIVAALIAVMAITIFQSIAYYQLANVLPVWLQDHGDMNAGGFPIPIPWFQSIDPLFSILFVPVLFGLWRWQARPRRRAFRAREDRIGGLDLRRRQSRPGRRDRRCRTAKVLWVWPFLYCALQGIAFMYFWPTLLALVSRAAPREDQRDDDGRRLPDAVRRATI